MRSLITLVCLASLIVFPITPRASAGENLSFAVFGGFGIYSRIGTNNLLVDLLPAGLEANAYTAGIALGRDLTTGPRSNYNWEAEIQVVKHIGNQHHLEFDGAILFRLRRLPWDGYLDTSLAIGNGLSYATRTPEIEARRNRIASRLLNFLVLEAAFSIPSEMGLELVVRLNHRSGIYGLFNGVSAGSNFLAVGIRMPL